MTGFYLLAAAAKKIDSVSPKINGDQLMKNGLSVVWTVMAIVAVVIIVFAGFQYISSNGDPQKASTAMKTILYAVIGLVVAVLAFAITQFVLGAAG
jgi:heme/copper-type cytochrome/quinol oxidase subunit 2